jgi:hypothetical protein
MDLEHYTYFSNNNFLDYEFYSDGPKGKIKKIVRFTRIFGDPVIHNLVLAILMRGQVNWTTRE